jgi:hypothetical protein
VEQLSLSYRRFQKPTFSEFEKQIFSSLLFFAPASRLQQHSDSSIAVGLPRRTPGFVAGVFCSFFA